MHRHRSRCESSLLLHIETVGPGDGQSGQLGLDCRPFLPPTMNFCILVIADLVNLNQISVYSGLNSHKNRIHIFLLEKPFLKDKWLWEIHSVNF